MNEQIVAGLRTVESDHCLLLNIFQDVEAISLPCQGGKPCGLAACEHQPYCSHTVRECFHRVLFATIGHFGREERLLCRHAPSGHAQQHAHSHAEIKESIQQAIAAFTRDKDAHAAFAQINQIANIYRQHYRDLDTECRSLLAGTRHQKPRAKPSSPAETPSAMYTLPLLPPSGNAAIDRDHANLQDLLQQARSVCNSDAPDCLDCDLARQQYCTTRAIDIVTDTLKSMIEHFRYEEALMRSHLSQEESEPHLHAHADISYRMSHLIGDYADNNTALFLHRLTETLYSWLKHHIIEHDLPLIEKTGHATGAL